MIIVFYFDNSKKMWLNKIKNLIRNVSKNAFFVF